MFGAWAGLDQRQSTGPIPIPDSANALQHVTDNPDLDLVLLVLNMLGQDGFSALAVKGSAVKGSVKGSEPFNRAFLLMMRVSL